MEEDAVVGDIELLLERGDELEEAADLRIGESAASPSPTRQTPM